jgi:hypothetical protein
MRMLPGLVLLLCPAFAVAQAAAPADPALQRDILAIEQRIGQANFDCDYRYFAEVEAPEFIFTDAAGGVTTRAEDLAGEHNCRPAKGSYVLEDVRLIAIDSVVVFSALATTSSTRADGEHRVRKQRFTDVLVRRHGRWQLIAGHSSQIP